MVVGEFGSPSLVIAGQAPEARGPGKRPLDDPAPRQQHKSSVGFRILHHLQSDSVPGCVCPGLLPRRTLINVVSL